MNPIYRGQYPPTNTDVIWLKDKTAYTFSNDGWAPIDNNSSYSRTQIDDMLKHYGKALSYSEDTGRLSIMNGEEELSYVTIKITLDDALSETSENGIKNKAIYNQYMDDEDIDDVLDLLMDYENMNFSIKMLDAGNIKWSSAVTEGNIEYKINGGEWTSITSDGIDALVGDVIEFRGTGEKTWVALSGPLQVTNNARFKAFGNLGSVVTSQSNSGNFSNLFQNTKIVSAKNLIIKLYTNSSWASSFPYMFSGCSMLKDAPDLSQITGKIGGNGATFTSMFEGCTSLKEAPELPQNASWANSAANRMFYGCTSLIKAPSSITGSIYSGTGQQFELMFYGCTSLEESPVINVTDMYYSDYYGSMNSMFNGCTSLKKITCLCQNSNSKVLRWTRNVASTGTFIKASGTTWRQGEDGIPTNWTVEEV